MQGGPPTHFWMIKSVNHYQLTLAGSAIFFLFLCALKEKVREAMKANKGTTHTMLISAFLTSHYLVGKESTEKQYHCRNEW
jgi:uncharacterized protein YktB (UPF0637 family)